MTSLRNALAAAAALVVCAVSNAGAADLNQRGSLKDEGYQPAPMSDARWYVRLDGGYSGFDVPNITAAGAYDLKQAGIDSAWSLGGGVGWYVTKNVRTDITFDHRYSADVSGTLGGANPPSGSFGLTSDVLLANVYYDFDMRSRFTPYVGLGLGIVRNQTSAATFTNGCVGLCNTTGTIDAGDTWHVAAAAMAGASFAVRDRMHVDAGYRFLYLGDAQTGAINTVTGSNAAFAGGGLDVSDLHAHEFRFGLRYDLQ